MRRESHPKYILALKPDVTGSIVELDHTLYKSENDITFYSGLAVELIHFQLPRFEAIKTLSNFSTLTSRQSKDNDYRGTPAINPNHSPLTHGRIPHTFKLREQYHPLRCLQLTLDFQQLYYL